MPETPDLTTTELGGPRSRGRVLWLEQGTIGVVDGPDQGRRFLFRSPRLAIGTADDNDIVLTDRTVSKHHVAIQELPDGYLLQDLGSRNGTYHDETRVKEIYLDPGSLIRIGKTVLRFEPPAQKVQVFPSTRTSFGDVRGHSPRLKELFGLLERIAPTDLTVLLIGETGTGKEVFAHAVHKESKRADRPFVVFDCSAVPKDLMESSLFGHREGAFTGATGRRKGAFLSAHTGTLFLDEVGELDPALQPKLLRVLEKREVQQLGCDQVQKVDVRIVAATNRNLREYVKGGSFRQDLYYRLSIVELQLPPLRERREDVPVLVEHFLNELGARDHAVTPAAMGRLCHAPWPGNVRELKNVVDRALALAGNDPIDEEHLALVEGSDDEPADSMLAGDRTLEDVEAAAIRATLARTGWNKSEAARVLGITRKTLKEKIDRYGLVPEVAPGGETKGRR